MGLAVSQIRLLALTTRKADIELQMQVNSKRKQMLTRRSTELAQQYYNRLQDSNIQYATSAGYENVNYNYLMGQTSTGGRYTTEFLKQVMCGNTSDGSIPQKFVNGMILTNQYGQVIANNQIAEIVAKTKDCYPAGTETSAERTAHSLLFLLEDCRNNGGGLSNLYNMLLDDTDAVVEENKNYLLQIMKLMVKNGGGMDGGTVYTTDLKTFYRSAEGMKNLNPDDRVELQEGYMYAVRGNGPTGSGVWNSEGLSTRNFYIGGTGASAFITDPDFSPTNLEYLGNIVSYFAPILSAALANGTAAEVQRFSGGTEIRDVADDPTTTAPSGLVEGEYIRWILNGVVKGFYQYTGGNIVPIESDVGVNPIGQDKTPEPGSPEAATWPTTPPTTQAEFLAILPNPGDWCIIDGRYFQNTGSMVEEFSGDNSAEKFYSNFVYKATSNDDYYSATNTDVLQSGFKSGVFQLCMVDNIQKGSYHKNTTLKYFTHMNYVVDKADSSKREEITAWFNAENALISEQETYWDTEIQNLSTELTSVNTEIESVKKLKSDSIKSVFDWGGQ
ncbi:MAG: hypothetical protein K6E29_02600 [Cyanobacteria bacterium RUI128]|nr:hypothetical protein [Cyanobacteria bacterium RUI128]